MLPTRSFSTALATIIVIATCIPVAGGPLRDRLMQRMNGSSGNATADVHAGPGFSKFADMQEAAETPSHATLPPGTRLEKDVPYGKDPLQRVDVYIPPDAKSAPMLLMVHGGGWRRGDKNAARLVDNKVAHWLPEGFIVVFANYRLLPAADPLTQADDVAKALALVQTKAASWGGDSKHLILMGHSAGAHLVALLTADPAIATKQGAKPWLGTVVLDSACLNVPETMQSKHFRLYDQAFKGDPTYWKKASPFHRLTAKPLPLLLVSSSRRADSTEQAQAFAEKVTALGGRATTLPLPLSHMEINQNIGASGSYTDAVDAFIRSLGVPYKSSPKF